jgi:histone demethylase JARID1
VALLLEALAKYAEFHPWGSKRYPDLNKLEEQLENVREEKIKAKKKRKLEIAEAQKVKNQEAESNEPKPKKAREDKSSPRKAPDGPSKKQQSRRRRKNSESSQEEEEQEDCSANPKCQRPTGKEVHWVQCDGCELWFHLHCIGLKPEHVSEDEDFICKDCKPKRQNQRKKRTTD